MSPFNEDIRWEERFSNYKKALAKLGEGVEQLKLNENALPEHIRMLLIEGLIQRFEFTHELAWKLIKDYANYQGSNTIMGSRDATRYGLRVGILQDERWMQMIQSRNITSHCYDGDRAVEVYRNITDCYLDLLYKLEGRMHELQHKA